MGYDSVYVIGFILAPVVFLAVLCIIGIILDKKE